jgi:hypothetical protein
MRSTAEVSVKNFQEFYDALSLYKRSWLLYYEFMAAQNTLCVPHCNTKENGLISLFIKPIPGDYAKNRHNTLWSKKYFNIGDFIIDFWKQVQIDYDRFKSYLSLSQVVGDVVPAIDNYQGKQSGKYSDEKHDKYEKENRNDRSEKKYQDKPSYDRNDRQSSNSYKNSYGYRNSSPNTSKRQNLNMSGESPMTGENNEDEIEDLEALQFEQLQYQQIDEDEEANYPPYTDDEEGVNNSDNDYDRGDQSSVNRAGNDELNAMEKNFKRPDHNNNNNNNNNTNNNRFKSDSRPKFVKQDEPKKEPLGCFRFIRDGKCEVVRCKYSHDPVHLRKVWTDLQAMVKNAERQYGGTPERKPGGTPLGSSD